MTTIAYKNGIIAYDSRSIIDNLIVEDDYDKKVEINDVVFFLAGATSDFDLFIDAYFGKAKDLKNIDVAAIIADDCRLFHSSVTHDGVLWKCLINPERHYAIGSGRDFAIAFMDAGYSAEHAIAATIKRDCWTGGKIRKWTFPMNDYALDQRKAV